VLLAIFKKNDDNHTLTAQGEIIGGEEKKGRFGPYFIWPNNLKID
jgi:hypothetical protein